MFGATTPASTVESHEKPVIWAWGEQMIQTRHGQATPHMLITFADGTSELVLILEDEHMNTPKIVWGI